MASTADKIRFANRLELRRAAARKAGGRGRRLRRPPRILWPAGVERKYRKSLLNILSDMERLAVKRLESSYPQILAEAQGARPTADHARADDYGDEVAKLMSLIRTGFFGEYSDTRISELSSDIAAALAVNNKRQLGGVFKTVLGVDVFQAEPWLNAETRAFVTENVSLIKTLSTSYFDRIERLTFDGARKGMQWRELQKELRKATPATRRRAEVIARDQVGKFNGQLTELRQKQAGVDRYRWRTALDERVRSSHQEREGEVFEWSKPPPDGHPGEPIQCRCYAEPVLEDLVGDGL